mmetsp:Transcript_27450/g.64087  ORF Transcript_27450/g.64087 Transcript_27450/m.64087 type:complete len:117 (+) Transcript_27450:172-522(+)|eukprot:CAMPEP_0178437318 /NCGR_PEP_ID=MMETSP0689_2-20121128/34922_1 /TAXON_ID=160604 /ORGANISM="Amphidinium massartii, Strain CS-259" /LENGTH=116 /DNA_ID=CAMNT_0020059499 /DNA_START=159 /DNA_END=509 /DNA_ORIENTATION=+
MFRRGTGKMHLGSCSSMKTISKESTQSSASQQGDRERELAKQETMLLRQQLDLDEQLKEQQEQLDRLQELNSRLQERLAQQELLQKTMVASSHQGSETTGDLDDFDDEDEDQVTSV